jgi:hypothetical protein
LETIPALDTILGEKAFSNGFAIANRPQRRGK